MQPRTVIAALIVIVGLVLILRARMLRDPAPNPRPEVSLKLRANQPLTNALLCFDVINDSSSPIMCPDSWYVELQDGTIQKLSLAPSGDVRVVQGSTGIVWIPTPTNNIPWRLGSGYYSEDIVFDVKVRVDQSPMKQQLPSTLSRVQGSTALSDWIE